MDDLTLIFEEQHTHLRAVAYRLLGSAGVAASQAGRSMPNLVASCSTEQS